MSCAPMFCAAKLDSAFGSAFITMMAKVETLSAAEKPATVLEPSGLTRPCTQKTPTDTNDCWQIDGIAIIAMRPSR